MTAEKSCKCGEYRSTEHLFFSCIYLNRNPCLINPCGKKCPSRLLCILLRQYLSSTELNTFTPPAPLLSSSSSSSSSFSSSVFLNKNSETQRIGEIAACALVFATVQVVTFRLRAIALVEGGYGTNAGAGAGKTDRQRRQRP